MSRLNLVIADTDVDYLESIVNFLMMNYSERFRINSFSINEFLDKFIAEIDNKIDILLINPELYSPNLLKQNVKVIIILSGGRIPKQFDDYDVVAKYQNGNIFVSSILNIYTAKNNEELISPSGNRNTKVVAVYSPIGGVGKTTIAAALSVHCTLKGMEVLYLNMEDISSTCCFFKGGSSQCLSNLLYSIKEKYKNFQLIIEGTRCIDEETGVHFFLPPDSSLEIEEMNTEELKYLITQIKATNLYDVVFIDMSSSYNKRNTTILEECDHVVVVSSQDYTSDVKMGVFKEELKIFAQRSNVNILDKVSTVINKHQVELINKIPECIIENQQKIISIPMISAMIANKKIFKVLKDNSQLSDGVSRLLKIIFERF